MIDKGRISAIAEDGKTATVVPDFDGASVTVPLVIPYFLAGCLTVKTPVVYVTFQDNTGVILCRMDGDWSHKLADDLTVSGRIMAADLVTPAASFNSHRHQYYNDGGSATTSEPR